MISRALDRLFAWYAGALLTRPRAFVVVLVAMVVGLAAFVPRLRFDNSPELFFLRDDPSLQRYQRFQKLFGSDEYALVAIEHDGPWTAPFLADLRTLTARLGKVPDVLEATSIVNVRHLSANGDELVVGELIPPEVHDAAELQRIRREAADHPYYRDLFISGDGRFLGIVLKTPVKPGIEYKIELTSRLRALLHEEPYRGWGLSLVGSPVLDADVREIVSRESGTFLTLVLLLAGTIFLLAFRSWLAVALPLGVGLLSVVCALGLMGLTGAPFTIVSAIIPSFLISIGVGPTIFLLSHFFSEVRRGETPREAVACVLRESASSSFLSMVTTAVGLLAFASSKIRPVEELGRTTGIALFLSFYITVVLVPLILSRQRKVKASRRRDEILDGRVRGLRVAAQVVVRRRKPVLVVFAIFLVASAIGVTRLRADHYYLGMFKERTAIRRDYGRVDGAFKGSTAIELMIDSGRADGVKDPALLKAMMDLESFTRTHYAAMGVKPYSVADLLCEIHQTLSNGQPGSYAIPATAKGVSEALLLYQLSGDDELGTLATSDFRHARLRIGLKQQTDRENQELFAGIAGFVQERFAKLPGAPTVETTGFVHMWATINSYLAETELQALTITAVAVALVMMIVFRSVILGLLVAALNGSAVLGTLGFMGWAGIWLDPYTILIAGFALGILDDDSVHVVRDIQRKHAEGQRLADAVVESLSSSGQGIFYFSAALVCGFAVYAFSSVASLTKFGLLVAFTIVLGALIEFVFSPATLLAAERIAFRKTLADAERRAHNRDTAESPTR